MSSEEFTGIGRQGGRKPYSVIDVGSNSVRLVVFEGLIRSPLPIFNERELCGLGRGLAETNRLSGDAVEAALIAIKRYVALSRAMGAGDPEIVATAAVREAGNGADFVAEVLDQVKVAVRVLDGREEARLSCLGVLSAIPDADGAMGDLGGGSLEVVALDKGQTGDGKTLPLGPLRLLAAADQPGPALSQKVDDVLAGAPWLQAARGRTFYAVGGAWRSLARIHQAQINYPLRVIHHYEVGAADVENFCNVVARLSPESLDRLEDVNAKRRPALPVAALVMARLLHFVEPASVTFCAGGLREGLVHDRLADDVREQDPLIEACREFARHEGRFSEHGAELAEWMAPLFPAATQQESTLRLAVCLLSDTAWRAHPDYRADAAFRRVLLAPFPGINHRQRAFIALAVYVRYAGTTEGSVVEAARALIGDGDIEMARVIGLALRLGHAISGGTAGIVARGRLGIGQGPLVMFLSKADGGLMGPAVDKRLATLAAALNRDYAVEIGG